jgi:hypothetical protein
MERAGHVGQLPERITTMQSPTYPVQFSVDYPAAQKRQREEAEALPPHPFRWDIRASNIPVKIL